MPELTQEQSSASPSRAGNSNSPVVGDLRLHEFKSRIFLNTRMLRLWLPPGYEASTQDYPVLYLNDGQNLFDRATAHTGVEWQVDETADRLIRNHQVLPLIIVGIDNAQQDRLKEYLPYRSFSPSLLRVQGKRYPEFLQQEVMPFVERHYRVAQGPEYTALGGSSLGGLISLYVAMAAPGIFGRLLLESPSLYMSNRQLLRDARRVGHWPARIFLAMGTRETGREESDQEAVDDLRELEFVLRRAGLTDDRLRVKIEDGATHNEAAWARRFPEALAFLFGK